MNRMKYRSGGNLYGGSPNRLQACGPGGRYLPNTLENATGLRMIVCPHCRICNPYGPDEAALNDRFPIVRWIAPTRCHDCDKSLITEQPS